MGSWCAERVVPISHLEAWKGRGLEGENWRGKRGGGGGGERGERGKEGEGEGEGEGEEGKR